MLDDRCIRGTPMEGNSRFCLGQPNLSGLATLQHFRVFMQPRSEGDCSGACQSL
jgi:hypothetical protein